VIFFGLDYYNNKLYKGRFEEFDTRWGNEPKKKKVINMIVIVLTIIIAWGLVFINAWIFGRYKTY
jgi:flagellar basal body-associated protein FliL